MLKHKRWCLRKSSVKHLLQRKNLEYIKIYCQKITLTETQLLLRYKVEKLIKEENIEFA